MRICCLVALSVIAGAGLASAQSIQYTSPAGVAYRALADTGPVARAKAALDADPRSVEKIIALGVAQSGARQFLEAIETFSRGLSIAPNDPMLYRWRGHRYLSTRQFDNALADLTHGYRLDSTNYGILYHLGIVRFVRGEFGEAARMFTSALPRAPDANERTGATDWLWMSLMRAGRASEATGMLARRPDSMPSANAYAQRLKLYRGQIGPEAVFTPADTADVQVATLAFGVGNWYLVKGDTTKAREWFNRSVASGGWPGFGFIMSEVELRRLPHGAADVSPVFCASTPGPPGLMTVDRMVLFRPGDSVAFVVNGVEAWRGLATTCPAGTPSNTVNSPLALLIGSDSLVSVELIKGAAASRTYDVHGTVILIATRRKP